MSVHLTTFQGSIPDAIERAIKDAIDDAVVAVQGSGGHFSIVVHSKVFAGQRKLQNHRIVLRAIRHLMDGDQAPVHAVDSLKTLVPDS